MDSTSNQNQEDTLYKKLVTIIPSRMSSSKIQTCPACTSPLLLPPSVYSLFLTLPPHICPLITLNRRTPRCKHCDILLANKCAIDAELPPPLHKSPIREIEGHIERARDLIWEGVEKDELEKALPRMQEKLRETREQMEAKVEEAWKEYRGIWGMEA